MREIIMIIFIFIIAAFVCSCADKTADDWISQEQQLWDGQKYTDPQKAIEYLNNAIRLQPNNAETYNKRGTAYYNLGQYENTIKDDSEAIRLAPQYPEAYNNRAGAYVRLGEFQKAIEDYNQAIRLKPNHPVFYNNRAVVHLKHGKKDVGCSDAKKACELGDCVTLEEANARKYCR